MIPMGPYCLHIAIKFICRACFRYFADSSLNELDNVDIPTQISLYTHTLGKQQLSELRFGALG